MPATDPATDRREWRVARLADLEENVPTDASAGDTKLVLVRRGDTVHALAGLCPHRGVPMSKGVVVDDRIVCGVHRASFALETGELLSPPACEALGRYTVRIEGGEVFVTVAKGQPAHPIPAMAGRGEDPRRIVIVGNGAAGWRAAETLRREGFAGTLTVVGDDDPLPYDRTDLSKGFLGPDGDGEPRRLRDPASIARAGIELQRGRAVGLDVAAKRLALAGGDALDYDALIVATGCAARTLDVPGATLDGVHRLRTLEDARALRAALDRLAAPRVAIVGAGFVGLEAAAAIGTRDGVSIDLVMRERAPLERLFGAPFAERLKREHMAAGVRFHAENGLAQVVGDERVESVELADGTRLDVDLVLMAVGAVPRTDWLPFETGEDGGIDVDERLAVADSVWLAGDIARLPTPWGSVRIEHWRFAQETGELAARNVLGHAGRYDSTPFFWSMQQIAGSYTLTGHANSPDETRGDVGDDRVALSFIEHGRVAAVLAHGIDDGLTRLERRMAGVGPVDATSMPG